MYGTSKIQSFTLSNLILFYALQSHLTAHVIACQRVTSTDTSLRTMIREEFFLKKNSAWESVGVLQISQIPMPIKFLFNQKYFFSHAAEYNLI